MATTLEIGPTLAEARLRRGLSLDDVQAETRIRTRYLEAMEEERFGELPGEAYAKCFLRSYADFLELDGSATVAAFDARFAPPDPTVPVTQTRARRSYHWEPAVLLVLALVLGAGLAYLGIRITGGEGAAATESTAPGPRPAKRAAPIPAAAPETEPVAAKKPPAAPAILVLTAREPCWLEVRIGGARGKLVWTGTLTSKSRLRFGLRKPLWVLAGAPHALQATIGTRKAALPAGVHALRFARGGVRPAR